MRESALERLRLPHYKITSDKWCDSLGNPLCVSCKHSGKIIENFVDSAKWCYCAKIENLVYVLYAWSCERYQQKGERKKVKTLILFLGVTAMHMVTKNIQS